MKTYHSKPAFREFTMQQKQMRRVGMHRKQRPKTAEMVREQRDSWTTMLSETLTVEPQIFQRLYIIQIL